MEVVKRPNNYLVLFILAVFAVSTVSSCRSRKERKASKHAQAKEATVQESKFNEADAADLLDNLMSGRGVDDSLFAKGKVYDVSRAMAKAYADEDYFPIWLTENGDVSYVTGLLQELEDIQHDGLDTARYRVGLLKRLLGQYQQSKTVNEDFVLNFDTLCTQSYLQAARDLFLGAIVPKKADSLWFHANDSVWQPYSMLAALGRADADYPSLDSFRSRYKTYTLLRDAMKKYRALAADSNYLYAKQAANSGGFTDSIRNAIITAELPWQAIVPDSIAVNSGMLKSYQYYLGITTHRKKDSLTQAYLKAPIDSLTARLAVNMERLRWMQQVPEQKYIIVNIPLLELFFRINEENAMHMEVVVGKTLRQTPSLNANMANVVINPPWGVPPTIMKKDVLPGMARSGQAYLNKKGLKVYDLKGNRVSAANVNSNNYKRYVFRQDPGDDNALGYVKFNLPNKWDIYLHDTPHREDFGKNDRFLSSGCVRVQKPKELAEFILTEQEGKRYPISRIDSVITTKKTRYEVLKNKIPVHIVYLTAFEDTTGTQIRLLTDVYKRDRKLKSLLQ
ncbi:hypothetical protein CAP35_00375 [Chitinophagaceae bacterium IBVUCB1]|nr:hypothetical protein CAP35_00375 [Chitinophagaceae bacterium IBVUCB1]